MERFLLLDSNLLILLVVGAAKRSYVSQHKRLRKFDVKDFDLLSEIVAQSRGIILSPNVITEASNLIRQAADPVRSASTRMLARIVESGDERIVSSKVAVQHPEYNSLGIADAVLLENGTQGFTLLTVDRNLYLAAIKARLKALNFNYLRDARPDFNPLQ